MSLIKDVIDDSDYYILIIGGRYGSTNADGISYTEMEYRYALETQKPIIAFLHKNPDEIVAGKSENKDVGKKKLKAFRELTQKKMVKYWTNPDDLNAAVTKGIIHLKKKFPAIGWVKADSVKDEESLREIFRLQSKINELIKELTLNKTSAPKGAEDLAQGDEIIDISFEWSCWNKNNTRKYYTTHAKPTWNEIFTYIAPFLINECADQSLYKKVQQSIFKSCQTTIDDCIRKNSLKESSFEYEIDIEDYQRIKVQLIALGLIRKNEKSRSVKDKGTYWSLTEYGNYLMTQLIAIKKTK